MTDKVRHFKSQNTTLLAHEEIIEAVGFLLVFDDTNKISGITRRTRLWQNAAGDLYIFELVGTTFGGTTHIDAETVGTLRRWVTS